MITICGMRLVLLISAIKLGSIGSIGVMLFFILFGSFGILIVGVGGLNFFSCIGEIVYIF